MVSGSFRSDEPPVVVIVGETGSGKTALAVELAKLFDGEIIAADSRTVYRGMDIGTAKPTAEERQGIPHYGFDVVEPGDQFTAYDFQQLAQQLTLDIASRNRLPIIVGGTGLYVDAFLYGFSFRPKPDEEVRATLQQLPIPELQERVLAAGMQLPENSQNPRHLIRLLEAGAPPAQSKVMRPNTLVLGLRVPHADLEQRVAARVESMFAAGLVDEVKALVRHYSGAEALRAPGYKAVGTYLRGESDLEGAKRMFVRDDLHLAKRQRTWFKRNPNIHWIDGENKLEQANVLVSAFLHR